jgi:double-stranded uracil-DNA glycosylase
MVDRRTIEVYERDAKQWVDARRPTHTGRVTAFARRAADSGGNGSPSADLGCGPGWYADALPQPVVALDAAMAMLRLAREHAPGARLVQADLEALPVRDRALGSAWANNSYVHVARAALPMALADLHRGLRVGSPVQLRLFGGDTEHGPFSGDDFPGRAFSAWDAEHLADVVHGAGFLDPTLETIAGPSGERSIVVEAVRSRTLADTVSPGMRLLLCGLNPSTYSADVGVGYARPGNRFWPAALAAGIASVDRDARHALRHHGVGITDLVKRPTVAASELAPDEYRTGMARLRRLCDWLRPGAVAFVGLAGWRAAADRRAVPGVQPARVGGVPAYVLPSTSGLNARTQLSELVGHLRSATALADGELASRPATGP